ncbi:MULTISPECIES: hypothetical protein [Fusobacterium]|uniref:hypothetical protein n=1 Tax=Fusobacterium TaxID=848 RepID=UPI00044DE4C6|nr:MULTISPECIES: hypothetical protein [Fusobacterium]EUB16045.1 putative lipoprotein [Fusobacterium sp. CM22]PHI09441.1 hypothetical protein CA845_05250 [Fusobacterium polymorphum]
MKKILLILLSIFFLSCGVKNSNDNEHIFYLDNPSNEDIEIILDSQTYRLKARTFEILKLKTGEHIAELSDKRKVYFKIFENSKGGIINPTASSYVFNDFIPYSAPNVFVEWSEPEINTISIDNLNFTGTYRVVNDFIIDKNYIGWDFDIFEEINFNKISPEIEIKLFSKIFNPYEFLKQENLEYKDINKTKLNLEIKEDYSIPNFEDKKVKKYVEEIIELDKVYKVENDKNEQKKILEKYNTLVDKYINEVGAPVYIKILYLNKGVIITKVE